MTEFFDAVSQYAFMQYALLGGALASIACGIVGTYVVVKRIGYLAGGIAHSVLGGMGAAVYFGHSPIAGALIAAVVFALILGWVTLRWKQSQDTVIGALWSMGMAMGILFLSQTPGYHTNMMSFLFGSILMITDQDLYFIAGLDVGILLVVILFYKQFLAVAFDEDFARLRGVKVEIFYLLFLVLIAITVVIFIRIVGLIMVIALLTLPPAIAGHYARSLKSMMWIAIVLGIVFTSGGLALSYSPDLPSGPTIIVFAGVTYFFSLLFKNLRSNYSS